MASRPLDDLHAHRRHPHAIALLVIGAAIFHLAVVVLFALPGEA